MEHFKPFLSKLKFNWKLGIFLILLLGIPRFISVLEASKSGDYRFTSIIFVVMWLLPFIMLKKAGRRAIGMVRPRNLWGILFGILIAILFCAVTYGLGDMLYGNTLSNWFVYISKSYQLPIDIDLNRERFLFFMIFGITSMIFSPIGEELMYRGFIHRCFSDHFGENGASYIDSSAFALTHLAHFGILFVDGICEFRWLPALLWVIVMFLVSRIFFFVKQKSGSIIGPILSHAFFNLTMTYFIFYHIF